MYTYKFGKIDPILAFEVLVLSSSCKSSMDIMASRGFFNSEDLNDLCEIIQKDVVSKFCSLIVIIVINTIT